MAVGAHNVNDSRYQNPVPPSISPLHCVLGPTEGQAISSATDMKHDQQPDTIGGGMKKVLYTLQTVNRMGLLNASKALTAKNTCKACGLGMGGQMGGMTNEEGEFPAFCNKSVQAQSTDVQPPIPLEIFDHPLGELQELTGREMEHLGRLNTPLRKAIGEDLFRPISWDDALSRITKRLGETDPARSFFYSSGRSSNEAGF